jgi:Tol biopolymer transport system component
VGRLGSSSLWGLGMTLVLLGSCQASSPSPESDLIAFTSRRDGWFSIYTVRPDGTELRNLIDIVSVDQAGERNFLDTLGQPSWSFDGSRIAFTCPSEGQSAICIAKADGSDAVISTRSAAGPDRFPDWSPDGRIVFTRFLDEEHASIFVANPDGTRVEQLTAGHRDADAAWSPDGEKIAFIREAGGRLDVYVMNTDGSDARALTDTDAAEGSISWSPDGEKIAFIIGSPDQDIYVMDTDGGNKRNLTRSPGAEGWPTWSPDGTQLAFMCGPGSGICVMSADGSGLRHIVGGEQLNMQPAWTR